AMTEATCGDPQQPVRLQSVVYQGNDGGRFIVVYHEGAPRKYLKDMNADSIVEREMWGHDGDGACEATRTTLYTIQESLVVRRSAAAGATAERGLPGQRRRSLLRRLPRGRAAEVFDGHERGQHRRA